MCQIVRVTFDIQDDLSNAYDVNRISLETLVRIKERCSLLV